ncbi:hypothetical protein PENSPDRAFT_671535 [Peniophora sp. CONT]|nr:hypothetical protein PENSPDRAFT_671535 [Peniophora sp. CONT]
MSEESYYVHLSKDLVESGAVESVTIHLRSPPPTSVPNAGARAASQATASSESTVSSSAPSTPVATARAHRSSAGRGASGSRRGQSSSAQVPNDYRHALSDEPGYFSCQNPRDHTQAYNVYYVVIRGIHPGIWDCHECAKEHGKGLGHLPASANTFFMRKDGEDEARAFWRAEYKGKNVRQFVLNSASWFSEKRYTTSANHGTD